MPGAERTVTCQKLGTVFRTAADKLAYEFCNKVIVNDLLWHCRPCRADCLLQVFYQITVVAAMICDYSFTLLYSNCYWILDKIFSVKLKRSQLERNTWKELWIVNRDSLNIQHTKTYLNLFLLSTLATQIYPTRPPKSWRIYSTMLPTNKTSQVNWYRRLPTKLVVPAATVLPALILITHAARSTSKVEE